MAQYVQLVVDRTRAEREAGLKNEDPTPELLLAQDQEIQQLMVRFQAEDHLRETGGIQISARQIPSRLNLIPPAGFPPAFQPS
jgi:hypothetical protein